MSIIKIKGRKIRIKKGALHRQLRIPKDRKIPKTLLVRIKNAKEGEIIKNPTNVGKRRIKVTRKLERRAIFALTLRKFKRKSKKR